MIFFFSFLFFLEILVFERFNEMFSSNEVRKIRLLS